jgi:hypothetical protein
MVSLLVTGDLPHSEDQGTGVVSHHLDLNQARHFPGSVGVLMMIRLRLSRPPGLRPIAGMAQGDEGRMRHSFWRSSFCDHIVQRMEVDDHEDHQKNWNDSDDCAC